MHSWWLTTVIYNVSVDRNVNGQNIWPTEYIENVCCETLPLKQKNMKLLFLTKLYFISTLLLFCVQMRPAMVRKAEIPCREVFLTTSGTKLSSSSLSAALKAHWSSLGVKNVTATLKPLCHLLNHSLSHPLGHAKGQPLSHPRSHEEFVQSPPGPHSLVRMRNVKKGSLSTCSNVDKGN